MPKVIRLEERTGLALVLRIGRKLNWKKQLRVLIEDRELLMVALNEFIAELKGISEMDVMDEELVSRIMELKLIVEPMLLDVQSESKNIQGIMRGYT